MAFDFPGSPSEGQVFQPAGGPSYKFTSGVWTVRAPLANHAFIGDAPPPGPVPGQLWYESDSGGLFIWLDDGNSQQWVQVTGPIGANPTMPVRQTFVPGSTSLVIPVPAQAKHAKIYGKVYWTGTSMQLAMRMSSDGVNFPAAGTDYVYGGQQLVTGSSGSPIKIALASGGTILVTPGAYSDSPQFPVMFDGHVVTNRLPGGASVWMANFVGYNYHSAATALAQHTLGVGYNNAGHVGISQLAALQFVNLQTGTFLPQSTFVVDWSY